MAHVQAVSSESRITDEHRTQYRDHGFFVLRDAMPATDLEMVRSICDQLVAEQDAEMDRLGTDQLDLSRRGSRYFAFLAFKDHPELASFIFSDLMADVCRATVGDDCLLFWEQFVVKGSSESEKASFSWHQDAGYVHGLPVPSYVNAWVALDDVNEDNGTVYLLPYSEAGTRERVEHKVDPESGDRIGYFGDHPGIPVIASAGSIAVFSSTTFHRSGTNTSGKPRRAYALQFATDTVYREDRSVMGLTEQFLVDGRRVR